jgi:hypothetical protein
MQSLIFQTPLKPSPKSINDEKEQKNELAVKVI